jgi:uncharacterized protein
MPTVRCVVPSRAQPGFEVNRQVTRAVATRAERCLGVYCWVESGGSVRIGDQVDIRPATAPRRLLTETARRAKRLTFGLATGAMDRLSR